MSLKKRLTSHCTCKGVPQVFERVQKIRTETGCLPTISYLDEADYEMRREVEEYWIQQFAAWGFPLLNIRHYKNRNYIPVSKRVKRRASLSESEMQLISLMHRRGDNELIAKRLNVSNELVRLYSKNKTVPRWYKDAVIEFYSERARAIAEWHNQQSLLKTAS